ncbi:MAG: STAS domain-containing protein [Lachnospiraceae bacterium]|nr:STAS domain-containing protein [Lachnospiraceae bacterium]
MLNIEKKSNGAEDLTFVLSGRLDTTTSPDLDNEVKASLDGVKELVFDITDLQYISSAGLRVLLSAQKVMNKQGSMIVKNPSDEVKEIFDVTGFADILTIE